jgi:hypothetical protein
MAEQIVSPGVFTRENDQSFITQNPIQAGAAIIGPTAQGPVEIPTLVTSYSEFKNKFGSTFVSGNQTYSYLTSISAYNYFQNGGTTLLVTRVVTGSFTSANSTDITNGVPSVTGGPATGSFTFGGDSPELTGDNGIRINYNGANYLFVSGAGEGDIPADNLYFYTGSDLNGLAENINDNVSTLFSASAGSGLELQLSASFNGTNGDSITVTTGSLSELLLAEGDTEILSLSGSVNDVLGSAFVLKTISEGTLMNSTGSEDTNGSLTNGTKDNVRWEISQADTSSGTFTLLIRRGNDITNEKVVLETFANISLDPEQDNYLGKIVGDQYQQVQTDSDGNNYVQVVGEYPNRSKYVYVSAINYPTPDFFDNIGNAKTEFTASIPVVGSGSFGLATGDLFGSSRTANFYNNIDNTDSQGLEAANYTTAIDLIKNKDEYVYNVVTVPGLVHAFGSHTSEISTLVNNTQNRGDAIVVADMVGYGSTISAVTTQASAINSSYTATYWPWTQIINPDTGKTNWVPASTLIPGVYAANDRSSEPWFAPAGINRGGLTQVIRPERKLQRADRDVLYEGNVNPIANFPATGPVVFGQKTLQKRASALDRVNVRRLLIALKGFIGQVANNLVFEQNTQATRNNFLAQVNPYLESVQQRQGVYAFRVVMDDTNNTPDVIDRNQLIGQIFIQPTRTAEFIILDFNVLPTGAEFPS